MIENIFAVGTGYLRRRLQRWLHRHRFDKASLLNVLGGVENN